MIYSHHHFDHAIGGKPFKDLGAKFVAHKNAKKHLEAAKNSPDVVMPDEWVDNKRVITLGGTTLELLYMGRNHSDNSLVMRLPKEKIIFAVDFLPIPGLPVPQHAGHRQSDRAGRIDRESHRAWIGNGDPRPSRAGRPPRHQAGHRGAARLPEDLNAEVKKAAANNKCFDTAMKDIKLPKYQTWGNYEQYLAGNVERYCFYFGRGL